MTRDKLQDITNRDEEISSLSGWGVGNIVTSRVFRDVMLKTQGKVMHAGKVRFIEGKRVAPGAYKLYLK